MQENPLSQIAENVKGGLRGNITPYIPQSSGREENEVKATDVRRGWFNTGIHLDITLRGQITAWQRNLPK